MLEWEIGLEHLLLASVNFYILFGFILLELFSKAGQGPWTF